ncbi:hypothetical protein CP963_14220 [Arcobacter cloacae]|uniref:Uncharacterized protein n=1 Tax=Arcobacter cloacae TaxID=1054034 RepID=A0AA94FBU3_9BACT|nr:hypothetical protein [Arcobacter cloacae]RXI35445.1 hypothetical protein CP963_14220 [Arcobacter cloacae]
MLFGHGIGSGFYSYGNNEIVQQTELVYLDLFRMFGLILFQYSFFLLYTFDAADDKARVYIGGARGLREITN